MLEHAFIFTVGTIGAPWYPPHPPMEFLLSYFSKWIFTLKLGFGLLKICRAIHIFQIITLSSFSFEVFLWRFDCSEIKAEKEQRTLNKIKLAILSYLILLWGWSVHNVLSLSFFPKAFYIGVNFLHFEHFFYHSLGNPSIKWILKLINKYRKIDYLTS